MDKRILPTVSVRELSRSPRALLDRVARGERLIVCRHGRPVATLQPLDGVVVQPFDGHEYDVMGAPIGDAHQEVRKLPNLARALLRDGVNRNGRIIPGRISGGFGLEAERSAIQELTQRGLIQRSRRGGLEPTGRGWMLRDALLEGKEDPRFPPSWFDWMDRRKRAEEGDE